MMIMLAMAAGAAALFSPAATAGPDRQQHSVVVRYGDLDLATATGERRLRTRVASAVNEVCGDGDLRDLKAMELLRACRATANGNAQGQVATAMLNAKTRLASASTPIVVGLNKAER